MTLRKFNRFLREEDGAVSVIEAAFVYPVTILVVTALVFMGVYVFESAFLDVRTQMTADMAAKNISFSGYDELGDVYSVYDFLSDGKPPGKTQVNRAYDDRNPYRYLSDTETAAGYKEDAEKYAEGLFFESSDTECSVDVTRHMFGREVTVTVRKNIIMPGFFRMAGLTDEYQLCVSSSAYTADSAEFVRNTDLTADIAEFISEKTGVKDSFENMREKISEIVGNLRTGSDNQ